MKGSVVYSCACCRTPVATHDQLVSKSFHGRHGRAFLFASATNVTLGAKEERVLLTGLHSVADSFCAECTSRIGWKYLEAFESRYVRAHSLSCLLRSHPSYRASKRCARSQKYKEGKFIVEKSRVVEGEAL